MSTDNLLEVTGLEKHFPISRGALIKRKVAAVRAVDGVDFSVRSGETLGLVGESGCGKSTTGRLVTRLLEPSGGTVVFEGRDITHLSTGQMRPLRRDVQMIFQDPYSSLNPRHTVGTIVGAPIRIQHIETPNGVKREVLEQVGLPAEALDSYPHEFSGGQRQRIALARALAPRPELVVLDEPTSALDVSVQAQILNLLREMQAAQSLAYLFISHNLGVVRYLSDRVAVMYLGEVVELARTDELFAGPQHPYTVALLSAVLEPGAGAAAPRRTVLRGELPSAAAVPAGCAFAARCWLATDRCRTERPALVEAAPGRQVACHRPGEATLTDVPRSPATATTTTK